MIETILICTVEGSHKPILTALQELQPDYVLFFCTGTDPATGRPGSLSQITGKGMPVEVRGPGGAVFEKLPNIPAQVELEKEHFSWIEQALLQLLEREADA